MKSGSFNVLELSRPAQASTVIALPFTDPLVGQGLLIFWTHDHTQTDTPHLVGFTGRIISLTQRNLPDNNRNSNRRETFMSPVGFVFTFPAIERSQVYGLERAAIGNIISFFLRT